MKKSLFLICTVLFLNSLVFAQSDDVSAENKTEASSGKDLKKKLTKEEKALQRFRQNSKKDEYLDELYMAESSVNLSKGSVSVKLNKNSFNIFAKPETGMSVPVFSSVNNTTSCFLVKCNGKIYNLNEDGSVKREIRKTQDGGEILFTRNGLFRLVVDFKLVASKEGFDEDAVLITLYLTNISGKIRELSLKAVLDTTLGENSAVHFITADAQKLNKEETFHSEDLEGMRYLLSTDGKTSSQIMLYGNGISQIEKVTIANPTVLKALKWDENLTSGRGFNGVSSYNNSALMIEWPSVELDPKNTSENNFYVFVATDEGKCRGINYIDQIEPAEIEEEPVEPKKPAKKENEVLKKTEKTKSDKKQEADLKKNTAIEFVVPPVRDYQMEPKYIQNLIDRIDSLQSDSGSVNQTEIKRLNAELDAILAKIRQQ